MIAHKVCTQCDESQPITEFHKGNGRYGRRARCRTCVRGYDAARQYAYLPVDPVVNQQRVSRHRWRHNPRVVQVRSEDELRMALQDPYPFYAEPS